VSIEVTELSTEVPMLASEVSTEEARSYMTAPTYHGTNSLCP